jgi:methionyl-tRNA formyltransferase
MRIVFLGSPEFAVPSLVALAGKYPIAGVVTQPDRPAGRGRKLRAPAVKQTAESLGLTVLQTMDINSDEAMRRLRGWGPDVIVTAAFGQILRAPLLSLPQHGCINVHASLLPRWRGAAPIQAAILHGDSETGVTIMCMDIGLDTGPVLAKRTVPIRADETSGQLSERLATMGAELLLETLPGYVRGEITPEAQGDAQATYAPMLHKSDGQLIWDKPASVLARQVRAYDPWPTSFFSWKGRRVIVRQAHASSQQSPGPACAMAIDGFPGVGTSQGVLVLDVLQPTGRAPLAGDAFLRGARDFIGAHL